MKIFMPDDIDDRYVDVCFPDEDEFVFGCVAEPTFGGEELYGDYEDMVQTYTEAEAREYVERIEAGELAGGETYATRNFDQSQEGACVMNAFGQMFESAQCRTVGAEGVIHVAAMSGYQLKARSASSGMMVSEGADVVTNIGFLPLNDADNVKQFGDQVMANTGFKQKRPSNWEQTSKLFVAPEVYRVRSIMGMVTAALKGFGLVIGREGHSIYYCRPFWKNGWLFGYWNSWKNWGQAAGRLPFGFGVDSANQVKKSANIAYAIRTINVVEKKLAA